MWYYEALEDVTAISGNIIKKGEIIRIGGSRVVKMGLPLEEWQVLSVVDAEGSEYDLMKLGEVKDKFKTLYAVEEKSVTGYQDLFKMIYRDFRRYLKVSFLKVSLDMLGWVAKCIGEGLGLKIVKEE